MKKSIVLLLLMIFLTAFTTHLFAAGGQEEGAAAGPVKLEFWTRETQSDRMATIQILIDTYAAMNPDISIKLVPVEENDMALNMRAASAAGTMPSIIEIDAEVAVALGAEGILDTAASSALLERV